MDKDIIYILDACVFVKEGFLTESSNICICPYSVAEEVHSPEAQIRFDCMKKQGFVELINPKKEFIDMVKKLELKEKQKKKKLSRADIDVIALALEFKKKKKKICVITDDYLMQLICKKNKINYSSFFNRGI